MQTKLIERYFFFGFLLITLFFSFLIFKPFLPVLVIAASFSVVLYPVYEWLNNKKCPSWLSALITLLFFIIVICGPLFGIGALVFNQTQNLYYSITNSSETNFIQQLETSINNFLPNQIDFNLDQKIAELISFLSRNLATIFTTTLSTLFGFFLTMVALFFFLKDGSDWRKTIVALSPLADHDDNKILNRLSLAINGIVKGYLLIAVIQGLLMGLGLHYFGVPNAALWGVVAAIGSLIPTVGTALVSIPSVIFLFATGNTFGGIGLSVWAFLIVGWVDNLLNPIIISSKIQIPQILVLFSVLGGLALMGTVGFLIGPLTVSLLYVLLSIYKTEFQQ